MHRTEIREDFALTSRKGKTKPMVKLDIQLRQPATVYAAGRCDCLKSSAVIRKGTPAAGRVDESNASIVIHLSVACPSRDVEPRLSPSCDRGVLNGIGLWVEVHIKFWNGY